MESTGVYWKPLFGVLIKEGFEVYLVNSRHVKNVTGRKNDEDDACWILPPEILLFGHRFSQETKCLSVGHLLKSEPVSARISRAAPSPMP
jgi:hypothetical protein